ncbi:ATP-binding protein [Kineosporia succinea]|uniref:Anti-sigma regulatory factor (Ser/Thr protein kinase) n=1 Tax=Kineosporia succinea TaxID=84632 RepID=A0ABT9NX84_9ACTN|nr:ATP-binding protein [Kineosporia succinea]MDP9824610.1 anti-sigma regulatory factor (Ser/Thr protein kinase) [Kineosporia succinea]
MSTTRQADQWAARSGDWARYQWATSGFTGWRLETGDAAHVPRVRHQVMAALRLRAALGSDLDSAEIVVAELLSNTLAHTTGPAWLTLSWNGPHPLLSVADSGPGFDRLPTLPDDALAEGGRGLYLIAQLTHDLVVTPRPSGGSVVSVTLKLRHR